jgi:hypothetical protein
MSMSKERAQELFGKVVVKLQDEANHDPNHHAKLFLEGPELPPELENLFRAQDGCDNPET